MDVIRQQVTIDELLRMPDDNFRYELKYVAQGKKPVVFRLAQQTNITLAGKEAKLDDMEKGQQAQVEYVVRNDRNRARVVRLFEGGGENN